MSTHLFVQRPLLTFLLSASLTTATLNVEAGRLPVSVSHGASASAGAASTSAVTRRVSSAMEATAGWRSSTALTPLRHEAPSLARTTYTPPTPLTSAPVLRTQMTPTYANSTWRTTTPARTGQIHVPKPTPRQITASNNRYSTYPSGDRYGFLKDGKTAGAGKNVTQAQKKLMVSENMSRNQWTLRDDVTRERLVHTTRHKPGITPPRNEAHIDHILAKKYGGGNQFANLEIRARHANLKKGATRLKEINTRMNIPQQSSHFR